MKNASVRVVTCVLWLLFQNVVAQPMISETRVERRSFRTRNPHFVLWKHVGRAAKDLHISISFALKQSNMGKLESELLEISHPDSKRYGQFFSQDQIRELVKPSEEAIQSVHALLSKHGVSADMIRRNVYEDYIHSSVPVAILEKMFNARFHVYEHNSGAKIVRPFDYYEVPHSIAKHTDFIGGVDFLPTEAQAQLLSTRTARTSKSTKHDILNPHRSNIRPVTMSFLRKQYNIPDELLGSTDPKNTIAFTSFLGEKYSEDDLQQYLDDHSIIVSKLPKGRDKCKAPLGSGTDEASLDVQVIVGLTQSPNVQVLCYEGLRDNSKIFSDSNQEPFLEFIMDVNETPNPPKVISISYADDECAIPSNYAIRVNNEFIKAGLLGITLVAASGDNGVVGSKYAYQCLKYVACDQFQGSFPSGSPFVMTVGGTTSFNSDPMLNEYVASANLGGLITSGGGFSNLFPTPEYQKAAVSKYLQQSAPHKRNFNQSGRGYPDVTALSLNYLICRSSTYHSVDGTSASAPVVASILSLINEARLRKNQPHLGFANPLFYKLQAMSVFSDITQGDNGCGSPDQNCCDKGFTAVTGWDPASGLGSIDVRAFIRSMDSFYAQNLLAEGTNGYTGITKDAYVLSVCGAAIICTFAVIAVVYKRLQQRENSDMLKVPLVGCNIY